MIHTESQSARYLTSFSNGVHVSNADTTPDKGGGNLGFRPHELLEAALASCMNIMIRMYAEKHAIPLPGVAVSVFLNRENPEIPVFEYAVKFDDSLTETQKSKLLSIVEHCPVRKTLSKPLSFHSAHPDAAPETGI